MPPKTLSILCFGDSLTSGYYAMGLESYPYSLALAAKIQDALPDTKLQVYTNGKPGDVASFQPFRQRLQAECDKRHHDWVIILGGTNDLAYRVPPEDMYNSFQLNWDIPLAKGSKVLALTIPECKAQPAWAVQDRCEINSLILKHKEHNYHAFDLHAKLPYHSLSMEDREKYWDDGLHLTDKGYDWMGGHIADGFLATLSSVNAAQAPTPALRSRRPARTHDDSTVFEEESGNPERLNEGYVVVRKKDLW
ncbi:Esterase, SGNH hydrolase-type [Metarhizium rileyi]|uniref:Esterase, SGNH hydrolase-type n=1 Tax=Metarhizium rileyi (strain RCEF 4871) TaxID=1649241 RepID=A0A167I7W2_METRR|nr:Esterase, SGNH hydrolase-type [Metarhizium rileyi RCEF 4871]